MRLYPTRPTFHVALAGTALLGVGVALRTPPVVAFGGAMILAVAIGRAVALASVTRLRAAGFEMVWNTPRRVGRVARGGTLELEAEVRNRAPDDVRAVQIRAIASSMLGVTVEPSVVDLPAQSRVLVKVRVNARRVGRWGLHGMALEVRGTPLGGEGLYEVPLMFANPFGVEVFPRPITSYLESPIGGRARRSTETGRPAAMAGEGEELRELRDHVAGDPFKRIAWRASARRGKLMVREMERDQRDIVWLVLDASVDLWAGAPGEAPLDDGVDQLAALAARHLGKGDRVGLVVTASRLRTWLAPASGGAHALRIAAALASAASMVDADRCDLDEAELAHRVAEHARPLDPRGLADLPRGDLDALAARAESLRSRAPFAPRLPQAATARERTFRHYLAAFGVEVPPRSEGEAERTSLALAGTLEKLLKEKLRPSIVHVWAPPPRVGSQLAVALRRARQQRVEVRWIVAGGHAAEPWTKEPQDVRDAVQGAVEVRTRAAQARGERLLRKLGVRVRVRSARSAGAALALVGDGAEPSPPSGPPASERHG
jgi:uncharacterized protein (DUF58 family)